ncbi:hypothetical protein H072_4222 [Dactylellina haptotyla CBS 200.50]|uniref:Nudix hydrolase domain-containing protein n=1 Tax=Dactylellina haptotyla (strain CBS 200.50) TaxID=1284197 RepID=S8AFP4_DACHA|nr:hypothetical protein H072_4222 [Dactylellina haptotyla CBS 200.50]
MAAPKVNPHSYTTVQPTGVAVPRPSASLVLLDSQNRILLTHRTSTIGSFANAHVFPGGNQDPEDTSSEFCAIRETFEETGVLLTTSPAPSSLVSTFPEVRKAIHSHKLKFSDFLSSNNLAADVDSLIPYTTWITPPTMKKRYETKMFLAFLPVSSSVEGTVEENVNLPTSDGGVETLSASFMTANEILAALGKNEIILFPPQAYLITRLSRFTNDTSLSVQQQREAIKSWIEQEGVGKYVFEPRPEGKTKDGKRLILGYGPRGDPHRKSVLKFGKGGMPADLQIMEATEAAKL